MAKNSGTETGRRPLSAARPLATTVLVLVLSLGTWSFFYLKSMPLTTGETGVVVGFWLVIVFAAKWLLGRFAKKRGESKSAQES